MAIKLIVADDQEVIRKGLASILAGEDIEIVAEAATGNEAISKTKKHKPDVLLMDVLMPEMDGLDAFERIRKVSPATKVVMMSAHDNPSYVARAAALGAADFLRKDVPGKTFAAAIRRAVRGESPSEDSLFSKVQGEPSATARSEGGRSAADAPRVPGPASLGLRLEQPRDRILAEDQRRNRQGTRAEHPPQVRHARSHGGGCLGGQTRLGLKRAIDESGGLENVCAAVEMLSELAAGRLSEPAIR